jgi:polysaccharide chain length determinant protein (PEP-CTERM system associated)
MKVSSVESAMATMAADTPKESGLGLLLAVWGRRKWLAILTFAAPACAAISVILFLPNVYRSTATVLVDRQQVPEAFVRPTVTSALETRLHTISQEILSRSRLEALIKRFDLYADLRQRVPLEEVIEHLRSDIKLVLKSADVRGNEREATIAFTISYQGNDPSTVSAVTNTLAGFYIEENLKARERQAVGTAEFLKVQLAETKNRLDVQEQRVSAFKRRYLGELPQQMEPNLATLERLHAQLRQNADSQMRAAERRQTLSSQLAEAEALLGSTGLAASGLPESRNAARLAEMKRELASLRTQFSERYPDVIRLAGEVAALESELAEANSREPQAEEKSASPQAAKPSPAATPYVLRLKEALGDVQADLKVLKSEEARLRDGIAAYQGRVESAPKREQEFIELSRDYESTRELYQTLMKRHGEAQLAESMEQRQKGEQFRVIEPALPNPQPAAPSRVRLLVMAVALSLGLAVGAVVLAEHLDTSFHSVDDLRAFSPVPVLVSIPRIVTPLDLRRVRWRLRLGVGVALIGLVMIVGITYVVAHGNEQLVSLLLRRGS